MYDDNAITISGVSKKFKSYKSPRDRVLDLLGLGFLTKARQQEFWALKDINFQIKKGSKVALIGRNGAGKSTLLKTIAGTLKPTLGEVNVNGQVTALMELGTGFHPEFSGKDNIFASLSYMGVVGAEAQEKYHEIVDFSELEEFIHVPVKNYSAGMYARLAFATSTSIAPDILIIDEVLGAGDAYFVNKSMERMKKLTEGGTTVLFVSHDIASVQKLCTEAVWIERGRVVQQGPILEVSAEYLESIRRQEEKRLKARNIRLKQNNFKSLEEGLHDRLVYFHFTVEEGAPRESHPISKVSLLQGDKLIDSLHIGGGVDTSTDHDLFLLVDRQSINWSDPKQDKGVAFRSFEDVGGQFQHALFAAKIPEFEDLSDMRLEITYQDSSTEKVFVEYYDGEKYIRIAQLAGTKDNQWKTLQCRVGQDENEINDELALKSLKYESLISAREDNPRIYGSGEVIIVSVQFMNEAGEETPLFTSAEGKTIRISYFSRKRIYDPVFVVAYYLLDGTCLTQLISKRDGFDVGHIEGEGHVDIRFSPLLLGRGKYLVSVAIFKEVNLIDNVEPPAYDLHDKMYEVAVVQPFAINAELGLVNHPVSWSKKEAGGTR